MGDRTTVNIYLRKGDFKNLIDKKFKGEQASFIKEVGASEVTEHGNMITVAGEEINYADWEELESLLNNNNIDYDKEWYAGGDYEGGWEYVRGEQSFEVTDSYKNSILLLEELRQIKDPKKLIEVIEKNYKELKPFEPAPLDKTNSVRFIEDK